ncbi:MAG: PrgI family protein [Candidatus Wildermuthbacteria bacterium]|nr:PrgI family protein [Candidatus Wildermuthbacteria bacterium]
MQFQVPQFIERESKIIGPLTFRQFVFIALAAGGGFALFFVLPFGMFLVAAIILGFLAIMLAFVKVGPKTMPEVLLTMFSYGISTKTYFWRSTRKNLPAKKVETYIAPDEGVASSAVKLVKESKIQELFWCSKTAPCGGL